MKVWLSIVEINFILPIISTSSASVASLLSIPIILVWLIATILITLTVVVPILFGKRIRLFIRLLSYL